MRTILIHANPERISTDTMGRLKDASKEYELWFCMDPLKEYPERLMTVEISVGFGIEKALFKSTQLKWHHQLSAGVDWLFDVADRESLPFVITNVAGMHGPQACEHAFAMIFSLARGFPKFLGNQKHRKWARPGQTDLVRLHQRTMLVLGTGAIGSHIARVAKAHGMHTVGIRRNPNKPNEAFDALHSMDELDDLLPGADVVVMALPYSPETRNVMSTRQFNLMPKTGILINLGRGPHVDEIALHTALKTKQIHGAGCDTFVEEPLPESSPLWDLENLIISPHCCGAVNGYLDQGLEYFIQNLENRTAGKPMANLVDKYLGY